jgi:hypothetical protein
MALAVLLPLGGVAAVASEVDRSTVSAIRRRYDQKLWNPEPEGERGVPSHLT